MHGAQYYLGVLLRGTYIFLPPCPPATFEVGQVKLLYLAINYLSHEKEVSSVVV